MKRKNHERSQRGIQTTLPVKEQDSYICYVRIIADFSPETMQVKETKVLPP